MLVLPSVSIGNVPQLAIDLLIYTYGFECIKCLDNDDIVPFFGPMDYLGSADGSVSEIPPKTSQDAKQDAKQDINKIEVATAVQLYKLGDVYLILIRSPPVSGRDVPFLTKLFEDADVKKAMSTDAGQQCIVVGSADAGCHPAGVPSSKIEDIPKSSVLKEHNSPSLSSQLPSFPDSGYTSTALEMFGTQAVVSWVYEGDNSIDALELATRIVQLAKLPEKRLVPPISWSRVYGKDIPLGVEEGIYC